MVHRFITLELNLCHRVEPFLTSGMFGSQKKQFQNNEFSISSKKVRLPKKGFSSKTTGFQLIRGKSSAPPKKGFSSKTTGFQLVRGKSSAPPKKGFSSE